MDLREQGGLSIEQEAAHWWIRTRFLYLDLALSRVHGRALVVKEYGCGTGQNLWYLRHGSPHAERIAQVIGVDPGLRPGAPPSWADPDDRLGPDDVGTADVILCMDVLEHVDDDVGSLAAWARTLRPGGAVLITVPASPSLWSDHDVRLAHRRRYTAPDVRALVGAAGLAVERCHYAFGFAFPPAFLVRKVLRRPGADLAMPGPVANTVGLALGRAEFALGGARWFGTSVVALAR